MQILRGLLRNTGIAILPYNIRQMANPVKNPLLYKNIAIFSLFSAAEML